MSPTQQFNVAHEMFNYKENALQIDFFSFQNQKGCMAGVNGRRQFKEGEREEQRKKLNTGRFLFHGKFLPVRLFHR